MTLDVYSSAFGVREARAVACKTRVLVDEGGDPAMSRRIAKLEASMEYLRTLVTEGRCVQRWLKERVGET